MKITRLSLRNYRVFEQPLELELPPGLVGIYGVNGAGKSALMESIRWAIFGRSRTTVDEIRTSGVLADSTAEVEFEHEGHLYAVRRLITGSNATVKAEACANGALVAEGVRDVAAYVQSVLGVDDTAFRASVFAEQKQLAAFSAQAPGKRRELVLRLLGVTPLDRARDDARADAKRARDDHDRLRQLLPDLDELAAVSKESEARASTFEAAVTPQNEAATVARRELEEADAQVDRIEELRRAHDELVAEGKAVRTELANAEDRVTRLEAEVLELEGIAARLMALSPETEGLAEAERRREQVTAVVIAERAVGGLATMEEPAPLDEEGAELSRRRREEALATLAGVEGELKAARAEAARAEELAARSAALSDASDCPLCGQALGAAYEQVAAHRAAELTELHERVERLTEEGKREAAATAEARAASAAADRVLADARRSWQAWTAWRQRREAAEEVLAAAVAALGRRPEEREDALVAAEVERRRAALGESRRLEGRLERRTAVESELEATRLHMAEAAGRRTVLLDKVHSLDYRPEGRDLAMAARLSARATSEAAAARAHEAGVAAARARAEADAAAQRLVDGEAQHARLAELAERARHVTRLAELLNAFRNTVVAAVGPRLATQAAELFGELTDHEYDQLLVDANSYEIQISDAGRTYGMDRFSGSEIDLANLALRVAISEHVRFQSGGAVGLLVLDEVFGPLDEDRKARMMLALERLRSRFRQILVVTHASDIKEQLPSAIEVVKLPGRRATARVVTGV